MSQPCYDEDPATGSKRGWLCHECNMGLGKFRDSVELLTKAVAYLRDAPKHASSPPVSYWFGDGGPVAPE
jgi:hypothetical protein